MHSWSGCFACSDRGSIFRFSLVSILFYSVHFLCSICWLCRAVLVSNFFYLLLCIDWIIMTTSLRHFIPNFLNMIKRETRPAYHLMFAHAVCVLALTGLTLMFTPDTHASDNNWCDAMYSELYFQEVPSTIQSECGNRFIWNQNKIKQSLYLNELKYVKLAQRKEL